MSAAPHLEGCADAGTLDAVEIANSRRRPPVVVTRIPPRSLLSRGLAAVTAACLLEDADESVAHELFADLQRLLRKDP